jgi:antirestriction protein ArdC
MTIEIVLDPRTVQWPHNPTTGREFLKGNASRLIEMMNERGFTSGEFATFVQWKNAGRMVRKGERGTSCLLPTITKREDGSETVSGKPRRGFTVFAIEQTEVLAILSE